MTTFLFWNLNRKPLQSLIADLAHQHQVDVLMFAECIIPPDVMLLSLNRDGGALYDYAPSVGCEKIYVFTRFPHQFIPPTVENERTTIRHLKLPGLEDILLAVVHFPDKGSWKESSQVSGCYKLANLIDEAEKAIGHCKTVLVGDLNMNPFEAGVVDANGLHGVMSRQIAQSKTRVIQKQDYQFFYNPTWK